MLGIISARMLSSLAALSVAIPSFYDCARPSKNRSKAVRACLFLALKLFRKFLTSYILVRIPFFLSAVYSSKWSYTRNSWYINYGVRGGFVGTVTVLVTICRVMNPRPSLRPAFYILIRISSFLSTVYTSEWSYPGNSWY